MFELGAKYTRTEIQKVVGGELQTYLPQKNKIILAGCFNRELNPDCPLEIQAGKPGKVAKKAALLISQPDTRFPVFIKATKRCKRYQFEGYFKCVGGASDFSTISAAEKKSGRINELSYVLQLERVT